MKEVSPLFALEAEELSLKGDLERAVELCENGLKEYPDYPAAWAVLIQAYEQMDNIDVASDKLKEARERFPNNEALNRIDEELREKTAEAEPSEEISESKGEEGENAVEPEPKTEPEAEETETLEEANESEAAPEKAETSDEKTKEQAVEEIETVPEDNEEFVESESSPDSIEIDVSEEKIEEPEVQEPEAEEEKAEINDEESEEEDEEFETLEPEEHFVELEGEEEKSETPSGAEAEIEDAEEEKESELELPGGFFNYLTEYEKRFDMSPSLAKDITAVPGLEELESDVPLNLKTYKSRPIPPEQVPDLPRIKIVAEADKSSVVENEKSEQILARRENLEEISNRIKEASAPLSDEEFEGENSGGGIVSETMANIYIAQGAYEAAAKAYKELLSQNPDKKEYFMDKLKGLIPKLK